jgi:4-hydroxy-3-polyprenylbenzoate decarboxylase
VNHPWYTDNLLQPPMIESDLFGGLAMAGIDVEEIRAPLGGLSNIAYARIKTRKAGDSFRGLPWFLTRASTSGTTTQ